MTVREMIRKMDEERNQHCVLEILDVDSGEREQLKEFDRVIEAPNWTRDGRSLIFNSRGFIYRYGLKDGSVEKIPTGYADNCNNDHVISADGKQLAVSHFMGDEAVSRIFTLPLTGGEPRLVTEKGPSYLHGWSPDGGEMAFCGERSGEYNIYTIPVTGGEEQQITRGEWLDDGPEYSPCGRYIWFNSTRTGLMQIWRMNIDGGELMQMTDNSVNSWFPHVSPDGRRVVYLTYREGELEPEEHLPDKKADIRIMGSEGGESRILVSFSGGQGTINVNSWSPDSRKIAFVSY